MDGQADRKTDRHSLFTARVTVARVTPASLLASHSYSPSSSLTTPPNDRVPSISPGRAAPEWNQATVGVGSPATRQVSRAVLPSVTVTMEAAGVTEGGTGEGGGEG